MAYEHSTATDMHDLLDRLRLFLISIGYIVNEWSDDSQMYRTDSGLTASGSKRLHVQKALGQSGDTMDCYFNFRSAERLVLFEDHYAAATLYNGRYYSEVRGIGMNAGTGYDDSSAGSNWDKQPGVPEAGNTGKAIGAAITEVPNGSTPYWFFSNGDTVVVVAQILSNTFQFMAFGRLAGRGSYPGGMFFSASRENYYTSYHYWYTSGGSYLQHRTTFLATGSSNYIWNSGRPGSSFLYLNLDGVTAWRCSGAEGSQSTNGYAGRLIAGALSQYYNPLSLSGQAPSVIFITRAPTTSTAHTPMGRSYMQVQKDSTRFIYAGYPEGIRVINRTPYYAGESFVLGDSGGEEWFVFPAHQIGPDPDYPACAFYPEVGFAFLKSD